MKRIYLFLVIFMSTYPMEGAITVQPLLWEHRGAGGNVYEGFLIVRNKAEFETQVKLYVQDVVFSEDGKPRFEQSNSHRFSNLEWIEFSVDFFIVPAKKAVKIPFQIKVPEAVENGHFWSICFVQEVPRKAQGGRIGVSTILRYGVLLRTIIGQVEEEIQIKGIEFKENNLVVILKNFGNKIAKARVRMELKDTISEALWENIYPNFCRSFSFDLEHLDDGDYKANIIIETADKFFGKKFEFHKGEIKEAKRVPVMESEERRRRKRKPVSLYAVLNYGNLRRGLSLAGNLRVWDFTLTANSAFSQYMANGSIPGIITSRVGLRYSKRWFSAGMNNYIMQDRTYTFYNAGVNFSGTSIGLGYNKESKMINFRMSQRLFKKFRISFYGMKSPMRSDWNCSLSIPIL
jgi:hypothetical protein